ncbi:MAG: TonB-dependent receptor [Rubrivivax sp.]|jgi:iron complex outermembrane receptor protein|nr:TonB-dependent receptor [Rubrivivax sp.]
MIRFPLHRLAAAVAAGWAGAAAAQPVAAAAAVDPVFVTASPLPSTLSELVAPADVLTGTELLLRQRPTLGATLQGEPGVASTWFGPNASRPIIRGLGGFDILLLTNGLRLVDASASSPDHAVAVSPFAADRVEIVRGPAGVMHGGSALGGVVNVIDARIAQQPLERPLGGAASVAVDGSSRLRAGGARIDAGGERFSVHVDAYRTQNDELRIPGQAWTADVQADRGEAGPSDRLPGSEGETLDWGLGATAFVAGGRLGLSYGRFETDYGTVAEPGVTIGLEQDQWRLEGEWREPIAGLAALKLTAGRSDYTHTEFEDGEVGTVFDSAGWSLRAEALHGRPGAAQGAVGLDIAELDFGARGDEAFVPSTRTESAALFAVQQWPLGAWRIDAGARVGETTVDAEPFDAAGRPAASRRFTPWGASAGAAYSLTSAWRLGATLEYTQRAPASQELYADGPHLATDQFEVGNADLQKVASTALDLTLQFRDGPRHASVSVFYADFSNFIALLPTGVWRNPEDRAVLPGPEPFVDPDSGELVEPMQQFDFTGVRARLAGLEASLDAPLGTAWGASWSTRWQFDWLRADDRTNGQPLPLQPPMRLGAALVWSRGALEAVFGGTFAARQDRVPSGATETPGYADLRLEAVWRPVIGRQWPLEVWVRADNLLDQTIRYSTSTLKDIAPAGARAVAAGVRATF